MTALLALDNSHIFSATASSGSSKEHNKIVQTAKQAQIHRLNAIAWKFNISLYLFSNTDISEFEDRVEEIRDELMQGNPVLSREDINCLKKIIKKLDVFHLVALARLLGVLLEIETYSEDSAFMIKILLQHSSDEVRYAALEAIAYAIGEVPIAYEMVAQAKNLLENEESTFVREYLESL
ncbi:MAG TPA: hypothetical protein V6D25_22415 [Leptolyngbyaceae cyanobacterium]